MISHSTKKLQKELHKALSEIEALEVHFTPVQKLTLTQIKKSYHSKGFGASDLELVETIKTLDDLVQYLGEIEQQKILESLPLKQK